MFARTLALKRPIVDTVDSGGKPARHLIFDLVAESPALGHHFDEQFAGDVFADGLLWLAANTYELGSLAKLAHKGLRGRSARRSSSKAGLPPEYPTLAAQPQDRYLQVCFCCG